MFYAVLSLVVLVSIALGLYGLLKKKDLETHIAQLEKAIQDQEAESLRTIEDLQQKLVALERIRHVPGILKKAGRLEREVAERLGRADREAEAILERAHQESRQSGELATAALKLARQRANEILTDATEQAMERIRIMTSESDAALANAQDSLRIARSQAETLLDESRREARGILKEARKTAREKSQAAEEILENATTLALETRSNAEERAERIMAGSLEVMKRHDHYKAAAEAYRNIAENYENSKVDAPPHFLDDLAEQYGFHKAGARLKTARDRTRIMERNGTAATCNYPDGWKKDYAINFILSAFNGKVDSILSRIKPASQTRQIQEIRDAFTLVNHNGNVFRNARINPEFLEARLEEYKWAAAVQRLKDNQREEQRAIREQMREEERARKENEKALKQAEREEELLNRALEKARQEFATASEEERAKYEAEIQDLSRQVQEAGDSKRAISMAQQTRRGYVYVISNIGSFGEGVYKIGLTRRLNPEERVRELGSASVPFPFDVHALIRADDAPALETMLHQRFVSASVNKYNRRKEFYRTSLSEIREVVEELGLKARWTLTAEAEQYRETLRLEQAMKADPQLELKWREDQVACEQDTFDGSDEAGAEERIEEDRDAGILV